MKNSIKFLIVLLCLSTAYYSSAQFAIGPKVGVNIATFDFDEAVDEDLKYIVAYQFGVTSEITLNKYFAVQPELLFIQKGMKMEFDDFGKTYEGKIVLNYLELPLLAKVMLPVENGPEFYAMVGPSFGFGLDGKATLDGEEEVIDFKEDGLNRLDVSATFAAGIQIPVSANKVFVDARYLWGLTNLEENENAIKMNNRGIGITAGVLIPIQQ